MMAVAAQLLLCAHAFAETRLALIVTNSAYPIEVGALSNPHRDGAMIADALKAVGFKADSIVIVKDADQQSLRLAVADFVDRIEKAGPEAVAFLYYSGHGAADRTERGENYLVPIGAKITSARQLPIMGVSLTEITKTLERVPAKARFVVVDACRNVAFTQGLKDVTKGFIPERRLDGMIVAFATRPGETADDSSIYAAALASALPAPGLMAEEVFKETQLKVASLSGGKQVPWTEDGLLTRFRFKEAPAKSEPQPPLGEAARAWSDIKDLKDVAVLEAFRKQYGPANALYDTLATRRIGELTPKDTQTVIAQTKPAFAPKDTLVAVVAPKPAPAPVRPAEDACEDGLLVSVAQPRARPCLKPGSGESFKDCPDCPEMVAVPAGSFSMGSPENEPERASGEGPRHKVTIGKPFAVGRFAVTFAEWDACVADGGCGGYKPEDAGWGRDNRPVINVNWDDAKAFVKWLSKKTGKGYRLLSEAEREYAARAETTTPFWWGSSITPDQANYDGSVEPYKGGGQKGAYRQKTVPVKSFQPNAWGLYQVHGNVWEWVEDCWHDNYSGAPADGSAWTTGECKFRVLRGGSWSSYPRDLRAAFRSGSNPGYRNSYYGLRVARTLNP